MNAAPDWQDGECCFRCRLQFNLLARKHHCRNCGNIFCASCSSQQIPLPKLNIEKNVRVCLTCYEKVTGKTEDPLTLALDSTDKDSQHSKTSSTKQSRQHVKSSASAPSEQELMEEEELQLALALSLSEPTRVSFPDCHQFEDTSSRNNTQNAGTSSQSNARSSPPLQQSVPPQASSLQAHQPSASLPQAFQQQLVQQQTFPSQPEYNIQDRDSEVFRYVAETQSTLEVFNNRLNSCKLRNRSIVNDSAVQSLFLKLNTEVHPKITEYIRTYDEERAELERLQDKLSQIADARAALDDLREEHREKLRQQAEEAVRLRQTQLASKLEAMRQKKSQMMQYQRELAMQRIREQEMMSHQQQPSQEYQPTVSYIPVQQEQQTLSNPILQQHNPPGSALYHEQQPQIPPGSALYHEQQPQIPPGSALYNEQQPHYAMSMAPEELTMNTTDLDVLQRRQQQQIHNYQIQANGSIQHQHLQQQQHQHQHQTVPTLKSEEDAPLISFDD